MNTVSENLKRIRQERNLTQQQMADRLAVTQQTVSNWESGKTMPSPHVLQEAADKLNVDVNYILYGRKNEKETGYIKLFAIFAVGFILAEFIQSLRPAKDMLGMGTNRQIKQAVRFYNMTGFPIMMFCVPMVYTPPAVAFAKQFRTNFITKETLFSKHSRKIHIFLVLLYVYYLLHFSFNFTIWYIVPDKIFVPDFIRPLWQIITLAFYNSEMLFVLGGIIWGLRGSIPKTINTADYNTSRKNTIAVNLKNIRTKKNLTQQQMAEKLFVTQQAISNWENGKAMPDLVQLMDIADKMDVEIYDLLYNSPQANGRGNTMLYIKTAVVAVLFLLWLICDGTIFHNLPGMQAPVTSKPAILYFAFIPLRNMLKKAVIKPLIFFMLPQIIFDYLKINNAVKVTSFKYAGVVKMAVALFVFFFITGLAPVFAAELKDVLRTSAPGLRLKIPVINLPHIWRCFANFVAVNIAHNHPAAFSALGLVYSYVQKPPKQANNK